VFEREFESVHGIRRKSVGVRGKSESDCGSRYWKGVVNLMGLEERTNEYFYGLGLLVSEESC
jgi:hypothetical protein